MKWSNRARNGVLVVALATAVSVAGSVAASDTAAEVETVKVGISLSTSGVYAAIGSNELEGIEIFEKYQDEILDYYEVPDEGRRRLEFVYENENSDPTQAASIARGFADDDEVMAVIGGTVQAMMLAQYPILAQASIPWYLPTPNPYPNYNETPYVYGPAIGINESIAVLVGEYLASIDINLDDVAVILSNDVSSQTNQEFAEEHGFSNITQVPPSVTDYGPIMADLKSQGVTAIWANISNPATAMQIREAQLAADLDVEFVVGASVFNREFLNGLGERANGVLSNTLPGVVSNPEDLQPAEHAETVQFVQDIYTRELSAESVPNLAQGGITFDGAVSIALAVNDVDEVSRDAIKEVMDTQQFVGVNGVVERDAAAGNPTGTVGLGYVMVRYEDGVIELVLQR